MDGAPAAANLSRKTGEPSRANPFIFTDTKEKVQNMKYDFAVIGAGPAGYIAAKKAAGSGMKTLLVEKKTRRSLSE